MRNGLLFLARSLGAVSALCMTAPALTVAQETAPCASGARSGAAIACTLGFTDAVASAIAQHPDIAAALANLAHGRAELASARSVWLPEVSYQASLGPNVLSSDAGSGVNENIPGPGVTVEQLIWDFGRSQGRIGAASARERQREHELALAADQLAEEAALAFLEVAQHAAETREAEAHVQALERLRELIGRRAEAGVSGSSDLLLADIQLESARADAMQARTTRRSAEAALASLTGVVPDNYADPTPLFAELPAWETVRSLEGHPAVAAAEEAERATAARIDEARAERMPRIGLQLGYDRNNYTYNTRDNTFTAIVTLRGELYRAGASHDVTAARQEHRAAQAARAGVALDLRAKADAARETMAGGPQRIAAHRRREERARASRDVFLEEYRLGKRSLSDVLSAEIEINRAVVARIGVESELMRARVLLESAYGSLRSTLGLASQALDDASR